MIPTMVRFTRIRLAAPAPHAAGRNLPTQITSLRDWQPTAATAQLFWGACHRSTTWMSGFVLGNQGCSRIGGTSGLDQTLQINISMTSLEPSSWIDEPIVSAGAC